MYPVYQFWAMIVKVVDAVDARIRGESENLPRLCAPWRMINLYEHSCNVCSAGVCLR
jgi:hypothetical protein